MPEFDPATNGRRPENDLPPLPPRGRGVMLLVSVSGMTALSLLVGSLIGGVAAALLGLEGRAQQNLFLACAGVGSAVGVWLGVRMAERFGGTSGEASRRSLVAYGLVGLLVALALAAIVANPLVPITAIMLPGVAAVVGDVLGTRELYAAHAARAREAKKAAQARAEEQASEQD